MTVWIGFCTFATLLMRDPATNVGHAGMEVAILPVFSAAYHAILYGSLAAIRGIYLAVVKVRKLASQ